MASVTSTTPEIKHTEIFIDGQWLPSQSGKTFETINPATEEVIANVAEGDAADIDLAVKAARAAFESGPWTRMDARDRGQLIYKLADLIEQEFDELAALESLDNGKPISDARAADLPLVDRLSALLRRLGRQDSRRDDSDSRQLLLSYTRREPVGVVGQIIPWNFPMLMAAWKWGPALAAGCTIVMKPAEQTPLTCLRMAQLGPGSWLSRWGHQCRSRLRPDRRRCHRQASGRRQNRVHRRTSHRQDHSCATRPTR